MNWTFLTEVEAPFGAPTRPSSHLLGRPGEGPNIWSTRYRRTLLKNICSWGQRGEPHRREEASRLKNQSALMSSCQNVTWRDAVSETGKIKQLERPQNESVCKSSSICSPGSFASFLCLDKSCVHSCRTAAEPGEHKNADVHRKYKKKRDAVL